MNLSGESMDGDLGIGRQHAPGSFPISGKYELDRELGEQIAQSRHLAKLLTSAEDELELIKIPGDKAKTKAKDQKRKTETRPLMETKPKTAEPKPTVKTRLKSMISFAKKTDDEGKSADKCESGEDITELLSDSTIMSKIEAVRTEIAVLRSNLDECSEQLRAKYAALELLNEQARLRRLEHRSSASADRRTADEMSQELSQLRLELCQTADALDHSQQVWAERFNSVSGDKEAMLQKLELQRAKINRLESERTSMFTLIQRLGGYEEVLKTFYAKEASFTSDEHDKTPDSDPKKTFHPKIVSEGVRFSAFRPIKETKSLTGSYEALSTLKSSDTSGTRINYAPRSKSESKDCILDVDKGEFEITEDDAKLKATTSRPISYLSETKTKQSVVACLCGCAAFSRHNQCACALVNIEARAVIEDKLLQLAEAKEKNGQMETMLALYRSAFESELARTRRVTLEYASLVESLPPMRIGSAIKWLASQFTDSDEDVLRQEAYMMLIDPTLGKLALNDRHSTDTPSSTSDKEATAVEETMEAILEQIALKLNDDQSAAATINDWHPTGNATTAASVRERRGLDADFDAGAFRSHAQLIRHLVDLLCDRSEALAHQRLLTRMLATKVNATKI